MGPKEKAVEAIRAGKTEEALRCLNEVYEQFHTLHDAYGNEIGLLKGTLAKMQGDKWYETFERKLIFESFRSKYERYGNMSIEQRVEGICNSQRAHYSEFHVEEDGEKFVVLITGCNAGGAAIYGYDQRPSVYNFVAGISGRDVAPLDFIGMVDKAEIEIEEGNKEGYEIYGVRG